MVSPSTPAALACVTVQPPREGHLMKCHAGIVIFHHTARISPVAH